MGQQTLIYSFVARGTVILAEYSEFTGNFNSIASQCLQKLPTSNNKFSYNCDGHTFNFLSDNGFSQFHFISFLFIIPFFFFFSWIYLFDHFDCLALIIELHVHNELSFMHAKLPMCWKCRTINHNWRYYNKKKKL